MTLFVIGIISTILVVAGLGFTQNENGYVTWNWNPKQLISLVGTIFIVLSCVTSVETGHTGIVTTFGQVQDYTFEAGLHAKAPWNKVTEMDNRTQKQTLLLSCFSSDLQEVNVLYTLNYQIQKQNAQIIFKTIGTEYFQTVISPRIQEAVKAITAKYTAENMVASRDVISSQIQDILVSELETYNVDVVSTSVEDVTFSEAYKNAIEAKQVAEQNKKKVAIEQEQAIAEAKAQAEQTLIKEKAESEKKIITANANAESLVIASKADAEAVKISADSAEYQGQKDSAIMEAIGRKLNEYPELLTYYNTRQWDGSVPETMLGANANVLSVLDNKHTD